ncbi:hypothetical protein IMX07_12740 [bacterium]|nr:hypothetical protein [bacterium]
MPRKPKNVEFLNLLSSLLELKGKKFAQRIGKKATNVNAYLSGARIPQKKALLGATRHAFEWDVIPLVEVEELENRQGSIPRVPGIYALFDSSGSVVYLGQALDLRTELNQALNRRCNFPVRRGPKLANKHHPKYKDIATHLSAYQVDSKRLRHNLEALLLRFFPNQSHNNKMGNFI